MQTQLAHAYRQYFPLLVHKCTRMLGDSHEAQDIAQESFIRLHKAGLMGAEPRLVTAWLYRTSTRLAIDRLRARTRFVADGDALTALVSVESAEAQSEAQALWATLVKLVPEQELEAALLSRVDGLSQSEVAEVMGIHERTVRRALSQFEARVERVRKRSER